ncbi:MAG: HlyD family secretion protein [Bryobacteraceae bacterium]|jgi:membrane fusion protein (multidrug efflux system)
MANETLIDDQAKARQPRKRAAKLIGIGLGVIAAVAGGIYYLHSRHYESTDDAFIAGDVIQVSPRVAGQVLRVYVEDNQHVSGGDLIAEIDARDYEARAAEARAGLADISARADGAQSNLRLTSTVTDAVLTQTGAAADAAQDQVQILQARAAQAAAAIRAAEAALGQAEAQQSAAQAEAGRASEDAVRYRALYASDEVSKQQLDRAETLARSAAAAQEAASQGTEAARAHLSEARAAQVSTQAALRQAEKQVVQAQGRVSEAKSAPQQIQARHADVIALRAGIAQALASVQQAELALSYTRIYASESGHITRKSVEPGDFVQPGQPLVALVSDRLWVVANFKETQLTRMRAGQPVTLKLDAFPQLRLRGHVQSFQSGTGAAFSLLPAENATGNYVKVVQRVPVKIVLDEAPPAGYRIGPGMSVEPEVKVR